LKPKDLNIVKITIDLKSKSSMNDLSKRVLKFTHNPYYPKDYYYDKLVTKYEDPKFFCDLYDKEGFIDFKTAKKIKFKRGIGFDSEYRDIIAELGKPNFTFDKSEFFNYKILFYRFKIGGHKTKCELHLLNDKLFFFNYVFSYLSKDDKEELNSLLGSKYLHDKTLDIRNYKVKDSNNNMVLVESSADYSIVYMSGEPSIYDELKNELEKIRAKKERHIRIKYNQLYRSL